ncbi:DUF1819 family protein [Salibacterium sp. K-3]
MNKWAKGLNMEYSAGFTKEKWSENDIAVVLKMLLQGKMKNDILEEVTEKNLFQLRSPISVNNRFNMVYKRAATLDDNLKQYFLDGSQFDRKALTLYSFLKVYRMPLEFYTEVIRLNYEHQNYLYNNDFYYFFEKKAKESEKVQLWRPETITRLIRTLTLFFKESEMITKVDQKKYEVRPIHMSQSLKNYAKESAPLLASFTNLKKVNE